MSKHPGEQDVSAADDGEGSLLITVVRSGGVTGIPRTWSVVPESSATARWAVLIERCPWGDESTTQRGADRFLWRIGVRRRDERHEQVVSDAQLSGAWRDLVDAVRAAATDPPRQGDVRGRSDL